MAYELVRLLASPAVTRTGVPTLRISCSRCTVARARAITPWVSLASATVEGLIDQDVCGRVETGDRSPKGTSAERVARGGSGGSSVRPRFSSSARGSKPHFGDLRCKQAYCNPGFALPKSELGALIGEPPPSTVRDGVLCIAFLCAANGTAPKLSACARLSNDDACAGAAAGAAHTDRSDSPSRRTGVLTI